MILKEQTVGTSKFIKYKTSKYKKNDLGASKSDTVYSGCSVVNGCT